MKTTLVYVCVSACECACVRACVCVWHLQPRCVCTFIKKLLHNESCSPAFPILDAIYTPKKVSPGELFVCMFINNFRQHFQNIIFTEERASTY